MTARARTIAACDASVLLEAMPFRDLLHRAIALRLAEQRVPDAQYTAVCEERQDTEDAIKARLCAAFGLASGELAFLGDML